MAEQSLNLELSEKNTVTQGEIVHDNNPTEKSKKALKSKAPNKKKSKSNDFNIDPPLVYLCKDFCLSKSGAKAKDEIRCCLCMGWMHTQCLQDPAEVKHAGIWMCSQCRMINYVKKLIMICQNRILIF